MVDLVFTFVYTVSAFFFICVCLCVWCCVEFDRLYQALGVTLQERGESYYNNLMPEMVQELERKGEDTRIAPW